MDGLLFDDAVKALARARSRRAVLRGLAGAVAGGVLAPGLRASQATPAPRGAGHPCEGQQTCAEGLVCVVSGPGNARRCTDCGEGWTACDNYCVGCPSGYRLWGDQCPTSQCVEVLPDEVQSPPNIVPPTRKY